MGRDGALSVAKAALAIGDRARRRLAKALPIGVLGMIPLIWAVENHVAHRQDLSTIYAIEWKRTGLAARRKEIIQSPVLCFGTSLTRFGVSPRVIEERTGLPAYNLALSAAQPFSIYATLRRALESGARPRAIVVDFMWLTIGQDPTFNERVAAEMLDLRDCAEFAREARDPSLFGRLALATLLPSYRARGEVRANIDCALRGVEPGRVPEKLLMDRNAAANRGASHTAPGKYDGSIDPDHPMVFPRAWTCPPISEHAIDGFLALADSRKIPVFWLLPPLPPKTRARLAEVGVEAEYLRLVARQRALHPEVVILDGSHAEYHHSAFFDVIHLNRDGAAAWTADVAAAIGRHLGQAETLAGAWDRLPDYRPDPRAARLEDIDRTQAILRAALDRAAADRARR